MSYLWTCLCLCTYTANSGAHLELLWSLARHLVLGRVESELDVFDVREFWMRLVGWINEVLDLSHSELSVYFFEVKTLKLN